MTLQTGKKEGGGFEKPKILIAGLGNLILRDDGVRVHAVREFQQSAQEAYLAVDVGCAVMDALHLFEWAENILLIDAMQAGGDPGTVYRINSIDELESGGQPASLHELSVVQALKMIRKDHHPEVVVIGIEPEVIDYGLDLSGAVQQSLPLVLQTGQKIVEEWTKQEKTM